MRTFRVLLFVIMSMGGNAGAQSIDSLYTRYPMLPSGFDFADRDHGVVWGNDRTTNQPLVILTTDGGLSWVDLMTHAIFMAFPSIDLIFRHTGGGVVLKSTDLGQSWIEVHLEPVAVGLSFPTPSVGYTGYSRTTDSGGTWETYAPPYTKTPPYRVDCIGFEDPAVGFALSVPWDWQQKTYKLCVTKDSAKTWDCIYEATHKRTRALHLSNDEWLISELGFNAVRLNPNERILVGSIGQGLARDKRGEIYGGDGFRSSDSGKTFHQWPIARLEQGEVDVVDDSIVYFMSLIDTSEWRTKGNTIYRVNLPSSAFEVPNLDVTPHATLHSEANIRIQDGWLANDDCNAVEIFDLLGRQIWQWNGADRRVLLPKMNGVYILRLCGKSQVIRIVD